MFRFLRVFRSNVSDEVLLGYGIPTNTKLCFRPNRYPISQIQPQF